MVIKILVSIGNYCAVNTISITICIKINITVIVKFIRLFP
jgi:hypothetical protein